LAGIANPSSVGCAATFSLKGRRKREFRGGYP